MFKTKWRIVTDEYYGYEVQCKRWWWPFWYQHGFVNSHTTVAGARRYIYRHSKAIAWQ